MTLLSAIFKFWITHRNVVIDDRDVEIIPRDMVLLTVIRDVLPYDGSMMIVLPYLKIVVKLARVVA